MNNIKFYRNQKGLTINKLAFLSNVSVGYICHLEKGSRSNPSYRVMYNISKALDKKIGDVFSNELM